MSQRVKLLNSLTDFLRNAFPIPAGSDEAGNTIWPRNDHGPRAVSR